MTKDFRGVSIPKGILTFTNPAECLRDMVSAWSDYAKIAEQEKTKRRDIEAWEKVELAKIQANRDSLIVFLEESFDERAEAFHRLFQGVDQAIANNDNQLLASTLDQITDLAKSNPFRELADLAAVKAALDNPDHTWEL